MQRLALTSKDFEEDVTHMASLTFGNPPHLMVQWLKPMVETNG